MQAIIMAAGKGSRLGALTADRPKSFVEIKGKSLIDINLHTLKLHGIEDIIIVTGCHAEKFEDKLGTVPGVRLVYNPFYGFTNVLGSFYMGMNALRDDFIYMHADTICEPSILEDIIRSHADIALPVDTKPCDEEAMKVKLDENGGICQISKRIPLNECAGEFIGIAKIKAGVLPALKAHTTRLLRKEAFSEYFEAALQAVMDDKQYTAEMITTGQRFWAEIDFMEDYERAAARIVTELYRF